MTGNARKGTSRLLALMVALCLLATSLPAISLADTVTVSFGTTNAKGVNLRTSVTGKTVHQVGLGTTMQIISSTTSNSITWYEVYYSGRLLYVQSQYITVLSTADSATYAAAHPTEVYTGSSGGTDNTTTTSGKVKTTASVNLRKSASTSSAKLATIPMNTTMSFDKKVVSGASVFYHVTYGTLRGYILSSFLKVVSASTNVSGNPIGTVTANTNTVIRLTAQVHGKRTGVILAKGATANLMLVPVVNENYTWYFIETTNGRQGYVRGDCVTTNYGGTTPVPAPVPTTTDKTYIKLNVAKTFDGQSVAAGTVLQLVTTAQAANGAGVQCYHVYYRSESYEVPVTEVTLMSADEFVTYVKTNVWTRTSFDSLKRSEDIVGSVEAHAVQLALKTLNYYSGALDGDYGRGTESAVKAFQKAKGLEVDGFAGQDTQTRLFALALGKGGGDTPTPSASKVYVKLAANTTLFDVNTYAAATTVAAGNVLQLVSETAVSKGSVDNYGIYYNNTMYYVPVASVSGNKLTEAELNTYITSVLWRVTSYTNINDDIDWTGSVLVHGLQLALKTVGYYTGVLDGDFGSGTKTAIKNFQRKNKLTVDGRAGEDTQSTLYPAAIAAWGGSSPIVVTGSYIRTNAANVPVYASASTGSATVRLLVTSGTAVKLASTTTVSGTGGTFYQVSFGGTYYVLASSATLLSADDYSAFLTLSTTGSTVASYGYSMKLGSNDSNFAGKYVTQMQSRLQYLGFYYNEIDGDFGSGTLTAVKAFQTLMGITVDGVASSNTLHKLYGTRETGSGEFGAINTITKGTWFTAAGGKTFGTVPGKFYAGYTNAKVLDCLTGTVFSVKRWAGGYHADVEPMTANDTKLMCSIYGVNYPTGSPSASELSKIKSSDSSGNPLGYWPNINYTNHWRRRPVLVNIGGEVFCGSMFGCAHNYPDGDTIANNNFYGQFCLHFWYSRTHSGSTTETWSDQITGYSAGGSGYSAGYNNHRSAINEAYRYAKTNYPALTK